VLATTKRFLKHNKNPTRYYVQVGCMIQSPGE